MQVLRKFVSGTVHGLRVNDTVKMCEFLAFFWVLNLVCIHMFPKAGLSSRILKYSVILVSIVMLMQPYIVFLVRQMPEQHF